VTHTRALRAMYTTQTPEACSNPEFSIAVDSRPNLLPRRTIAVAAVALLGLGAFAALSNDNSGIDTRTASTELSLSSSARPQATCKPQYQPFPISCINCKGKVKPQNVPLDDISKLWGVWYTVGTEKNVAIPDASCVQVNLHPRDENNIHTTLDYEGHFCHGNPSASTTKCSTAIGDITPTGGSFSADQPPYQLKIVEQLPFTTDFYFAATDGDADGNGITAMVTLSCPHAAQAFSGSQAFVLSRTPSVDAKTMKTLMERAKAAIPNFSEYSFHVPTQTQQCQYKWPTPAMM